MRRKDWMGRRRRSTGTLCVGLVERTMLQMSSGFVATYVKSGSMASAWRSLLPGLSTSSSTNAHHAATRELDLDINKGVGPHLCTYLMLNSANSLASQVFYVVPCYHSMYVFSTLFLWTWCYFVYLEYLVACRPLIHCWYHIGIYVISRA